MIKIPSAVEAGDQFGFENKQGYILWRFNKHLISAGYEGRWVSGNCIANNQV